MRSLDLPAGVGVRLTATARPDRDIHLWEMRVIGAANPLLAYRSRIGGRDVRQVIEIPAQSVDCQLELRCRHKTNLGWADDQMSAQRDGPAVLRVEFCDPTARGSRADDVVFSFAFEPPAVKAPNNVRSQARNAH